MICKKCGAYIDYNPDSCYTICQKCGHHNSNTQLMARVVGFYTNVSNWNDGKREEYKDRKEYKIKKEK